MNEVIGILIVYTLVVIGFEKYFRESGDKVEEVVEVPKQAPLSPPITNEVPQSFNMLKRQKRYVVFDEHLNVQ